ncbi:MAG TPA: hypothetical protein VHS96_08365 [Bacteroidia bacterium]|nr:hypothetical protein [Bacteroidia bacterium]
MAKSNSIFQVQGALGDVVFSQRNGQTIISQRATFEREQWRKNPKARRSHENAQDFGGAAKCASAIYTAIADKRTRDGFRPYAHNHIAKRLRRFAERKPGKRAADRFTFKAALPALANLDLGREGNPSKYIGFRHIGPVHRPVATRILGLRQAADAIDPGRNMALQCRITRKTITFPEVEYDPETWEWNRLQHGTLNLGDDQRTDWIPVDFIPAEGLTIRLQGALDNGAQPIGEVPEMAFVFIEWRAVSPDRPIGTQRKRHSRPGKPKLLTGRTVIRLAAIRCTMEQAAESAFLFRPRPSGSRRYRLNSIRRQHKLQQSLHPDQSLRLAMGKMAWQGQVPEPVPIT